MKKLYGLIFFSTILVADLFAVHFSYKIAEYIFKPLIVICLLAYFLLQTRTINSNLKKWIVAALLFSWLGDVLLMLQGDDSLFFLLGLSAFLMAHVFYILFFHFIRVKENITSRWYLLLTVVIYYTGLMAVLSPGLGDMKLPVRIYGVVISFMLLLALHMIPVKNRKAGLWLMSGAVLFVISDSVLAIDKFYRSLELGGIVVMLTYGMAQFFITEGAIRYISSVYKE
jgi:uncharacterized membrane protein YhhN